MSKTPQHAVKQGTPAATGPVRHKKPDQMTLEELTREVGLFAGDCIRGGTIVSGQQKSHVMDLLGELQLAAATLDYDKASNTFIEIGRIHHIGQVAFNAPAGGCPQRRIESLSALKLHLKSKAASAPPSARRLVIPEGTAVPTARSAHATSS